MRDALWISEFGIEQYQSSNQEILCMNNSIKTCNILYISVAEHCRKPKIFLVLTLIMESWRQWMKMVMKRKRKKKMNMWMKKEKMPKEGADSSE